MLGGLKQGADGRWAWRYDPILRTPASTPGRLNASPDVLAKRLAGVTCPTLLLTGAESWMVEPTQQMVEAQSPSAHDHHPPGGTLGAVGQSGWLPGGRGAVPDGLGSVPGLATIT